MAQFVNMFPVDLANGPALKTLNQMHSANVKANRVGAIVTNNGAPVTLSGTCSGTAILADHTTVAMTGATSGNQAYVELPSACYTMEGPIHIFVTCTDANGTTTLVAASGYVRATETDTVIDPGTIIPSVSQLIQAIEDAVDSIPADYSSLLASIAPIFSTEDAYSAGDYVWHSGSLYRAIDNAPAGSWNASLFEPVVITAESRFTVGGNNAVLLQRTEKSANRFIYYDVGNALQDHVGETISVSFDMKASTSRQIRVNPYQNAGYSIEDMVYFTPSLDYVRFSFTTKVKNYGAVSGVSHNGRIGFYDEVGDNTISIKNFKMELGSVATPWQMSAQDAYAEMMNTFAANVATVAEAKAYLGIE